VYREYKVLQYKEPQVVLKEHKVPLVVKAFKVLQFREYRD
jgi:hypothetical protein